MFCKLFSMSWEPQRRPADGSTLSCGRKAAASPKPQRSSPRREARSSGWEHIGENGATARCASYVFVPVTPMPSPNSSKRRALRYWECTTWLDHQRRDRGANPLEEEVHGE